MTNDLTGKEDLLSTLARQLSFPRDFGGNWDALEECLQDLLPNYGRPVVLVHEGIPKLREPELVTYLAVLSRVIRHRAQSGDPSLRVLFPKTHQQRIVQMLDRQEAPE